MPIMPSIISNEFSELFFLFFINIKIDKPIFGSHPKNNKIIVKKAIIEYKTVSREYDSTIVVIPNRINVKAGKITGIKLMK